MLNEPGRNNPGPRQCPYCGTRLNGPMNFCPHCGTNQSAAASHAATGEPVAHGLRPHFYTFGSVAAFALAFAAYGLLHHTGPDTSAVQVQGAVAASQDATSVTVNAVPIAPETSGTSAPLVASVALAEPPASPPVHPYAPPVRLAPEPSVSTHTYTAQRSDVSQRHLAEESAAARRSAANARADAARKLASERAGNIARNLASARASLDKNDLGSARGAIMTALAQQPDNGRALEMQSELVSREEQRDALLGYARLCAREGQWVCTWHNAGHALTVDASSPDARALLSRAIAENGASHARTFDPSLPGADDDQ